MSAGAPHTAASNPTGREGSRQDVGNLPPSVRISAPPDAARTVTRSVSAFPIVHGGLSAQIERAR